MKPNFEKWEGTGWAQTTFGGHKKFLSVEGEDTFEKRLKVWGGALSKVPPTRCSWMGVHRPRNRNRCIQDTRQTGLVGRKF